MIVARDFQLKKAPPSWFWVAVFCLSLLAMFYLGTNPQLIADWWWVLVFYNAVFAGFAIYLIALSILKLKRETEGGVIGSMFTWSFIKIVPILILIPVLSFYTFSFQSVQNNVKLSEQTYNRFNAEFNNRVDNLYAGIQTVRDDRYEDRTIDLFRAIGEYSDFRKDEPSYTNDMQIFLRGLINEGWACRLSLFDHNGLIIAEAFEADCAGENLAKSSEQFIEVGTQNVQNSNTADALSLSVIYRIDPILLGFLNQVRRFGDYAKNIRFSVDTSITRKRFLIDFSSTVLLVILSVLLIVFRLTARLMTPLNNLSLATREISAGNYDVLVKNSKDSDDMRGLIESFNEMSKQIKHSREGLDTHNLYLETILKYSFGVIGLDQNHNIQLINPEMEKILMLAKNANFLGKPYKMMAEKYPYLAPLSALIEANFQKNASEWRAEIELSLPDKHILLSCQGAPLDTGSQILGFVVIVKDITQLSRAQKKAAWGEVATRMAHEIKNPLTPILLSAQRLRNKCLKNKKDDDAATIDKTTQTIINQVRSMEKMVGAFVNYANTPQIERRKCALNKLINQTISLYDAHKNINIDLDLDGNIPDLLLDASSISRVLINLIKNATEAAGEKPLVINISTRLVENKNQVLLCVEDNGKGFDARIIHQVFEPYTTTKEKGSGLGMAIIQNIVEQHDAHIFVANLRPHGARVCIEFTITGENHE